MGIDKNKSLFSHTIKKETMRILFILFLFLPTLVFSQLNQTDVNGLRQGKWEKKQANGRLIYEGQFKDGKPVGEWKRYHTGGQIKAEIVYVGDTARTVLLDVWRKKVASGNYINQKKEGVWSIYKNREKVADEEYKDGVKNGIARKFYDTRQIMEQCEWKNGKQDGDYEVFYKSGKPYIQCKMKENVRNGLFLIYFENGQQELVGEYKNNLRHNEWKYHNKKGENMYSLFYDNGQILNPNVRDSIGNIEMQNFEKNKGAITDPEKFMEDPSGYMMKNKPKQ